MAWRGWLVLAVSLGWTWTAQAGLTVLTSVPEWAALVREIGGNQVRAESATTARQDPHRIEARPSLIARARAADLVVATGAELELAWLPLVLRESANPRVQPGQPGYFEAARHVRLLEIPARLDRADGDVHAAGNPHIQLDPRNLLKIGEALSQRMAELDPAQAAHYRSGWTAFQQRWQHNLVRWEQQARPLRGQRVWVQHKSFPYLNDWLGLQEQGALEPKPGVEPTSAHLASVLQRQQTSPSRLILRAVYQREGPAQWLAQRAGIPVVTLPFTVGGSPEAQDLTGLFDDTLRRLLAALN